MTKEEQKEWFKANDFIRKEMQFYSKQDFYDNANVILYYFKKGNSYIKQLYQYYVFANPNIGTKVKAEIWTFLTK